MRLLNVHTYAVREYSDEELDAWPDQIKEEKDSEFVLKGYAILSHQWTRDEVTFNRFPHIIPQLQVVEKPPVWPDETNPKKVHGEAASIYKLAGACAETRTAGFNHIWIDTICIDKSSSSELSEAINSMFRWYEKSSVCLAYLFGLDTSERPAEQYLQDFQKNLWFSRGWTLQELLAPEKVQFYDHDWSFFGTKYELRAEIEKAAVIPATFLKMPITGLLERASFAQKMSWLSRRTTSKVEDMSYCMLGLLQINMSLIYGEREKAFLRLQRKILKVSTDESIFVWKSDDKRLCGMLAPHPRCFRDSGFCVNFPGTRKEAGTYSMTNRGLRFQLGGALLPEPGFDKAGNQIQHLMLDCCDLLNLDVVYGSSTLWEALAAAPRYVVNVVQMRPFDFWARLDPDQLRVWPREKEPRESRSSKYPTRLLSEKPGIFGGKLRRKMPGFPDKSLPTSVTIPQRVYKDTTVFGAITLEL